MLTEFKELALMLRPDTQLPCALTILMAWPGSSIL